ncbi:hypothetical protein FCU45_08655 [Sulfurimonas crateris]|uniref:Uncharacterized protein n=1 Tax=Sulfurimonas crateris TaxID=2574727 RepID=A0A4U2Z6C4_9BACT|nr:hypothetical protein [Sulfurimonas crateris]TKI69022.1 hypothetical protein FCU45_08655 [Sulfurimonas crateris]
MKSILESVAVIALVSVLFTGSMYMLKLGINHINSFDMDEKVEAFANQKKLLCSTGIANNQKMLVSKNNNWEIYKNEYFKRDDLLLEIRLCRVEE